MDINHFNSPKSSTRATFSFSDQIDETKFIRVNENEVLRTLEKKQKLFEINDIQANFTQFYHIKRNKKNRNTQCHKDTHLIELQIKIQKMILFDGFLSKKQYLEQFDELGIDISKQTMLKTDSDEIKYFIKSQTNDSTAKTILNRILTHVQYVDYHSFNLPGSDLSVNRLNIHKFKLILYLVSINKLLRIFQNIKNNLEKMNKTENKSSDIIDLNLEELWNIEQFIGGTYLLLFI